jgi:predicted RNA-binding protein with PUA-like domain
MAYWLLKSEPSTWSWQQQIKNQITHWDGVRNFQAAKYLKTMKKGDFAFFYHSGEERKIVGIVEIVKESYPDPSDASGKFVMVDVKAKQGIPTPLTLSAIKNEKRLAHLALVKQSRLSVMPVDDNAWKILCEMGKVKG